MTNLPCPATSLFRISQLRAELSAVVRVLTIMRQNRKRDEKIIALENVADELKAEIISAEAEHFALHCGHVEELALVGPEAA